MKIQPKIFKSTIFRIFISLFPAQAGVIPTRNGKTTLAEAFPRASGGDPDAPSRRNDELCFSPRKRG